MNYVFLGYSVGKAQNKSRMWGVASNLTIPRMQVSTSRALPLSCGSLPNDVKGLSRTLGDDVGLKRFPGSNSSEGQTRIQFQRHLACFDALGKRIYSLH